MGRTQDNVPNRLVSKLFAQRKSGKYCDMTLRIGEIQLNVHKCVVAAFSPSIDKLMSREEVMDSTENTQTLSVPLNCPKFSCLDCATKVIDFLYIGKIQIDDGHVDHIRVVSEGLQVSELLKICKKHSEKCIVRKKRASETLHTAASDCITISFPNRNGTDANERVLTGPKTFHSSVSNLQMSTETSKDLSNVKLTNQSLDDSLTIGDDLMDETEWSGMKCPKCDSVFMSSAKYQQHCATHLGKTYTTCYVCNYASIRVSDVIKHVLKEDHGETVCSICLLDLGSNDGLKKHLQVHDQSQPFFCLTCNTQFQTRTALNSHIVRHTNETPFVCKECGRGFKWKHGLRSHMVTHSKLKSFLCDQCGFSTAHLRSFIDHKTIHSGEKFKCPKADCQFTSVRKESVKHHLMTHSKQKPYQCEVCGQAFSQSKNLRRHATSHNPSADPEKCPLCPYQTNRSDKFKAHFKRYHKDGNQVELHSRKKRESSSTVNILPNHVEETAETLATLSTTVLNSHNDKHEVMLANKTEAAKSEIKSLCTDEVLSLSSCSTSEDAVFVIPDGTLYIIDADSIDQQNLEHADRNAIPQNLKNDSLAVNAKTYVKQQHLEEVTLLSIASLPVEISSAKTTEIPQ